MRSSVGKYATAKVLSASDVVWACQSPPVTGSENTFHTPLRLAENRMRDSSAENVAPLSAVEPMKASIGYCRGLRTLTGAGVGAAAIGLPTPGCEGLLHPLSASIASAIIGKRVIAGIAILQGMALIVRHYRATPKAPSCASGTQFARTLPTSQPEAGHPSR